MVISVSLSDSGIQMWYEFIEVYVSCLYSNKNCMIYHSRYIDFRVMFINKYKCVRKYAHILDMLQNTRDIESNGVSRQRDNP